MPSRDIQSAVGCIQLEGHSGSQHQPELHGVKSLELAPCLNPTGGRLGSSSLDLGCLQPLLPVTAEAHSELDTTVKL